MEICSTIKCTPQFKITSAKQKYEQLLIFFFKIFCSLQKTANLICVIILAPFGVTDLFMQLIQFYSNILWVSPLF